MARRNRSRSRRGGVFPAPPRPDDDSRQRVYDNDPFNQEELDDIASIPSSSRPVKEVDFRGKNSKVNPIDGIYYEHNYPTTQKAGRRRRRRTSKKSTRRRRKH